MGKIGILGGTFDPIHNGHLWLGEQAYLEYGLDQVWFMPSGHPPHKQDHPVTEGEKRWDMVRLAIAGNPHFAYSDFELQRPGYTYTAQTLMNSYNQMASNVKATEKSVNALEASYQSLVRKGQAGTATQAEVQEGQNRLEQARTSLASLKEQEKQLRFKLLNMLGLEDSGSVSIGAIPEPDLAAIGAIDFESDKNKAIGNDSNVQNQRHSKAVSTAEMNQRFRQVDEAEGTAEASITAAYQELQARLLQYQAALESYTGAELVYQSQKRRQAAGMLSNTEYLQGEADYAKSKAAKETASMNLVQAYESYCWEVKGIG